MNSLLFSFAAFRRDPTDPSDYITFPTLCQAFFNESVFILHREFCPIRPSGRFPSANYIIFITLCQEAAATFLKNFLSK